MSKHYLILGAGGQLGQEFQMYFTKNDITFSAPDEKEGDIIRIDLMRKLIDREKPDIVINCAAYNAVDQAENNPEPAFAVNSEAPTALAKICSENGILLVHYSSDYVFDGKKTGLYVEEDIPNPLNQYGKSKLSGEKGILKANPDHLVLRLSWVIGSGTQNFLYKLTQWAAQNPVLKVSADEVSIPTFTATITRLTTAAVEKKLTGIYHLTSSGYASRYELARNFAELKGITNLIVPVPLEEFRMPAPRPKFSCLSNQKLQEALGIEIADWRLYLQEYVSKN